MKTTHILLIIIFSILYSCKTRNSENTLNYMQNIEQIATDTALKGNASTIQKGDQLIIWVTAKDMDVVKPFNQNYSSSEPLSPSPASGNTPSYGQFSVSGPTYIVDSDGDIDMNVIGKINTTGKNLEELKSEIRSKISKYVINPTVSVKLANYKITVLGEVNRPGPYVVADGQATILNAIGLAGELTMYGKRDDVLVIRTENGQLSKERINLKDAEFFHSPYYNLKQGDVIYVSANQTKEKTSKLDPKTGTYISIASVVLGLAGIFITIFKK